MLTRIPCHERSPPNGTENGDEMLPSKTAMSFGPGTILSSQLAGVFSGSVAELFFTTSTATDCTSSAADTARIHGAVERHREGEKRLFMRMR